MKEEEEENFWWNTWFYSWSDWYDWEGQWYYSSEDEAREVFDSLDEDGNGMWTGDEINGWYDMMYPYTYDDWMNDAS